MPERYSHLCLIKHHAMNTFGGKEACLRELLTALGWDELSASRPGLISAGETATGTHCTGGLVGPRAGLDAVERKQEPFPVTEIEPRFYGCPDHSPVTVPMSNSGSIYFK
jgi:hypothetical protein